MALRRGYQMSCTDAGWLWYQGKGADAGLGGSDAGVLLFMAAVLLFMEIVLPFMEAVLLFMLAVLLFMQAVLLFMEAVLLFISALKPLMDELLLFIEAVLQFMQANGGSAAIYGGSVCTLVWRKRCCDGYMLAVMLIVLLRTAASMLAFALTVMLNL
eukprot:2205789-Rhodomonas_salina.4